MPKGNGPDLQGAVHSKTRRCEQNLPYEVDGNGGGSTPQPSGADHGSQTVSGSVTAATLATAQTEAVKLGDFFLQKR